MIKNKVFLVGIACVLSSCSHWQPISESIDRARVGRPLSQMPPGTYLGSYYVVREGDTLSEIAYAANINVLDLVSNNHLANKDRLYPGQVIKLRGSRHIPVQFGTHDKVQKLMLGVWRDDLDEKHVGDKENGLATDTSPVTVTYPLNNEADGALVVSAAKKEDHDQQTLSSSSSSPSAVESLNMAKETAGRPLDMAKETTVEKNREKKSVPSVSRSVSAGVDKSVLSLRYDWPVWGRIGETYSEKEGGSNGIRILASAGEPVVASAPGTVVYQGGALRGYGNLVILRHENNTLTAYAHNEDLLVSDGEAVNRGQQIATVGSTGTTKVGLYFEIRYQGRAVDPLPILESSEQAVSRMPP